MIRNDHSMTLLKLDKRKSHIYQSEDLMKNCRYIPHELPLENRAERHEPRPILDGARVCFTRKSNLEFFCFINEFCTVFG
jgi:hypothetical protein